MLPKIKNISCHKIVNSRGDWTLRTRVLLDDGSIGIQTIPEGASKGKNEAFYLPVQESINKVTTIINDALVGEDPFNQGQIDRMLVEIDGTPNKRHLGGNSILSVSLAVSQAAAASRKVPLYKYLAELFGNKKESFTFPTPVFNILNGGKHANNGLSFQEFMVMPAGRVPFDEALEMGVTVYHNIENVLKKNGYDTEVGDEGGYAPEGLTPHTALDFMKEAVSSDFKLGDQVFFGIDAAADSFKRIITYSIDEEALHLSSAGLADYYSDLVNNYPIIYLEDPFQESDHKGWARFFEMQGRNLMIVGDDLVVTNPRILEKIIPKKLNNAVIVKPNQVGTLTETFEFIRIAKEAGMMVNVSHRSGDTAEDTFIADLAVAVSADFIKSGAPARGERVAKYNRLLEIFLHEKDKFEE
ncbi:phosphopyruvate hydratase [candidate division WWE3 bacterium]|nr:phosphopyruvate hydratase [candidate division WWE3 bacterium]